MLIRALAAIVMVAAPTSAFCQVKIGPTLRAELRAAETDQRQSELAKAMDALASDLNAKIGAWAKVERNRQAVVALIDSGAFFGFNAGQLPMDPVRRGPTRRDPSQKGVAASNETLDAIRAILRSRPWLELVVVAHTDDTGSHEFNDRLTAERSLALKSYISRWDVSPERIKAIGLGKREPIGSNEDAEGRMANRRIELGFRLSEATRRQLESN